MHVTAQSSLKEEIKNSQSKKVVLLLFFSLTYTLHALTKISKCRLTQLLLLMSGSRQPMAMRFSPKLGRPLRHPEQLLCKINTYIKCVREAVLLTSCL